MARLSVLLVAVLAILAAATSATAQKTCFCHRSGYKGVTCAAVKVAKAAVRSGFQSVGSFATDGFHFRMNLFFAVLT
jgi:hypothetical protein